MRKENQVYLDYNATTPLKNSVVKVMMTACKAVGNPSSIHAFGRNVCRTLESSRLRIAEHIGASPSQVIFTSGGTEANNMAIKKSKKGWILRSAIEHDSVRFANSEAEIIPVDGDGVLKLGALKEALSGSSRGEDALVSVMFSNNETGVIQPIDNVVAIAHEVGALVHCDAVQAFGKIPFQFSKLGVDSLAISAHKMGGPTGVGALIVSEKMEMSPFLEGGGQERRRRAGTENVLGIVGFSAALETIHQDDWSRIEQLRNQLERRILNVTSEAEIYGQRAPRAPNTSCIRMPGLSSEKQIIAFDMEGIAVSAGSACSSGKVAESHVLNAMGVNASEAIRVSLGWGSQSEDINSFVTVWEKLYRQFRDKK